MNHDPSTLSAPRAIVVRELHDDWTVTPAAGPVPESFPTSTISARVPGVVHMDLLAAGLIPDPYLDDNEAALAWIGLVDWTYETSFEMTEADLTTSTRHDIVFDGLDTVASVTLNGAHLIDVANQHRSYRLDVTRNLRVGNNALTVAFRSPIRYANAQSVALGVRQRPYPLPYEALRKSACNFGWDWGIATFTSGIWRGVRLESWSVARLAEVRVHADPLGDGGTVAATVRVERDSDVPVTVQLSVAGATASVDLEAGQHDAQLSVHLDEVQRWWPAGYGEQPLYDCTLQLSSGGEELGEAKRRVGFRTLRWDTEPDADGTPFQLIVNDQPVFVKGANWIPDDALFPRVDRARYERRLRQARGAHLNLIRVWGGGIYESDDFYDLCDELGLLTWQDFLFACAAYAEEEPLRGEVEAEARENIARLSHHASLSLFTGNNENLWGNEDWGWKERLDGKTWGAYYYYDLFPQLINELAPQVPYAPGSPFSPGGEHPNDERHGSMHLWEQWNRQDWATYREHTPRFVAEFGWQGPPAWTTLLRSVSDSPLTPESPGMIVHQKAAEGNTKLTTGLVPHYRVPEDIESWHWAMQLNQANAVGCALDWFRAHAPHTSGAVVWQLNDCWPVTSWAAVDGDEIEKPLLFALKNSFAPRVITIQPGDDTQRATLVAAIGNDTNDRWEGDLVIARRNFAGEVVASETIRMDVAPRSTHVVVIPSSLSQAEDAARELVTATLDDVRGLWFFAEPRNSALTAPDLHVVVTREENESLVTVTSGNLVRDLTLLVDKLDRAATVDHGLVTLLPGESFTFRVTGISLVDAEAIAAPEVTRSGNQLVDHERR